VEVNPDGESVDIVVALDSGKYSPPPLPERTERSYGPDELNKLAAGSGTDIIVGDAIVTAVEAALAGVLGTGLGLFLAAYVLYILTRGIRTDELAGDRLGAGSSQAPADDRDRQPVDHQRAGRPGAGAAAAGGLAAAGAR
jgi:hypothetical protein